MSSNMWYTNLQVKGAVDEAQEWALQVDVLRDEQCHQAYHGCSPIPPLVLRIEGPVGPAVGRLLVVHGDQCGPDDDGRHEQEVDQPSPLRHLLPHTLPCQNLRHERPRDSQHRQSAVDGLRCGSVKLHQAVGTGVSILWAPLVLGSVEFLHRRAFEDAERVILLLGIDLGAGLHTNNASPSGKQFSAKHPN
jgi:hypothetical protein